MHQLFSLLTGEFLLKGACRQPNGGSVILTRSTMSACIVYLFALAVREFVRPGNSWTFSSEAINTAIFETLPWFGVIFAAIYAALYTRFSDQWTYLAGLYNQIKQTEAELASTTPTPEAEIVMTEWKAGFIEDAEELHLATKPLFAEVIRLWAADEKVRNEFEKSVPRGKQRLQNLLPLVKEVRRTQKRAYTPAPSTYLRTIRHSKSKFRN